MMACLHVPLKVNDMNEDVYYILSIIKPEWPRESIEVKNLKGGFSCLMKHCCCRFDQSSSISFRVRHLFSNSPLNDNDYENHVLKLLSEKNLFPQIYSTFENGYCYEYVKGKPLLNFPLKNSICIKNKMLKAVATQLAQIHKMPKPKIPTNDYFDRLKNVLKKSDFNNSTNVFSKEMLCRELMVIESYVQQNVYNSDLVLSHGDLHIFNLLQKDNGAIQFLDWELVHVNHRAFDIAFFFQVLEAIGMANNVEFKLPRNAEYNFIKYYIGNINVEADVLYTQVQIYKLVVLLYLMITQAIYDDLANAVSKNPKEYHSKLLKDYQQKKSALLGTVVFEK